MGSRNCIGRSASVMAMPGPSVACSITPRLAGPPADHTKGDAKYSPGRTAAADARRVSGRDAVLARLLRLQRAGIGKPERRPWVDPVRIFDLVGIEPVDLGPQERA